MWLLCGGCGYCVVGVAIVWWVWLLLLLQVEEKVNKMQRNYLLQEQLKIIKRELGLEVWLVDVVL